MRPAGEQRLVVLQRRGARDERRRRRENLRLRLQRGRQRPHQREAHDEGDGAQARVGGEPPRSSVQNAARAHDAFSSSPKPDDAQIDDAADEQHHHHHHAGGGADAEPQVGDRLLEGVDREIEGRGARPALGQQIDLLELVEGPDRAEHDDDDQHLPELRQRDVEEAAHRTRAVDLGGVVELERHGLQPRQHADDDERRVLPHVEHDGRGHRHGRAWRASRSAAPIRPGALQRVVHHADLGIEDPAPDQRDHHRRHDVGKQQQAAKDRDAGQRSGAAACAMPTPSTVWNSDRQEASTPSPAGTNPRTADRRR